MVQLEEDTHISSILRLNKRTVIKPQSGVICYVKLSKGFKLPESGLLEVDSLDPGCILDEPGLTIQQSVHAVKTTGKLPVLLINQTNTHVRLRRGSVVGKGRALKVGEVSVISEQFEEEEESTGEFEEEFGEIKVLDKYRTDIVRIVRQNVDLFAKN
jgi:hypothetical protein